VAEKFLKQYEILLLKAKEDFKAAKYLYDGFQNHNLALNLEIIYSQTSERSGTIMMVPFPMRVNNHGCFRSLRCKLPRRNRKVSSENAR
jgi:hypothetical protein